MACKSKRCLQAGNCTCNYIDDQGNPIPGDGTVLSPHVHERQAVKCILDSEGNQLVPNADREVVFPNYIVSVELADGTVLTPDANGTVVLPTSGIGVFFLQDQDGNSISITNDTNISFSMDGGGSTGYAPSTLESPTFDGSDIVLPSAKVRTYTSEWPDLWDGVTTFRDTTQDLLIIRTDLPARSYFFPSSINLSRNKSTTFLYHYTLNLFEIEQPADPNYAIGSGSPEFVFDIRLYTNPDSQIPATTFETGARWTPDYGFGQKTYTGTVPIVANDADDNDVGALEIYVQGGMNTTRNLVAHLSGVLQWV